MSPQSTEHHRADRLKMSEVEIITDFCVALH